MRRRWQRVCECPRRQLPHVHRDNRSDCRSSWSDRMSLAGSVSTLDSLKSCRPLFCSPEGVLYGSRGMEQAQLVRVENLAEPSAAVLKQRDEQAREQFKQRLSSSTGST